MRVKISASVNELERVDTIDMNVHQDGYSFVKRWVKFLYEYKDQFKELDMQYNSPHCYDAQDLYLEEFTNEELDTLIDDYTPSGHADFGCDNIISIEYLDSGEWNVLYE